VNLKKVLFLLFPELAAIYAGFEKAKADIKGAVPGEVVDGGTVKTKLFGRYVEIPLDRIRVIE
jgi:hypothetical protein